jgi:hypothetical protein
MLVAGKSAAAAAAWVSVLEAGLVSAERVWAPAATQVWETEAMVASTQAQAPLPSG